MATKIVNSLAGLPAEVTVKKLETHSSYQYLWVAFPEEERICPHYGSCHCILKDSDRDRTVYHTAARYRSIHLHLHLKRYYCRECKRTFMQQPGWLHPTLHITQLLYIDICVSLTKMISLSMISQLHGVPESIISSVLELISYDIPDHLPEVLAIDEFKADSG